jgi:hypothetical protein
MLDRHVKKDMNARKHLAQDRCAVHQAWLLVLWKSEETQFVHGVLESFGPSRYSTFKVNSLLTRSYIQFVLTFIVCKFGESLAASRVGVGKVDV